METHKRQNKFSRSRKLRQLLAVGLSLCLLIMSSPASYSQGSGKWSEDGKLKHSLEQLVAGFHGEVGIYVAHLKKHKSVSIHADSIFPTASIIKVPIMIAIFDELRKGNLSYNQEMIYDTSRFRGGSGLLQFFKEGSPISLDMALSLMIGYSDNAAALWFQELAGGGKTINELLQKMGLNSTRVNSRTEGRAVEYKTYGWGQTTPKEMVDILIAIRQGRVIDQRSSDRMYRLMTHVFYDGYALSQIPPYIQTASKQGMVDDARSELVMVNAPHGDYVFYVATKNNKDTRWQKDNEAWELARTVSSLLWKYYEPEQARKWKPAVNAQLLTP